LDLRKEILETFDSVFAYDMSDIEIDAWLRLSENSQSANYDIFKAPSSAD
jgi:iron complex transport system substrate-binding protein